MQRREFLQRLGLGLAGAWAGSRLAWPRTALGGGPELRLALLADAHLPDGHAGSPEAQALARAVAEIRALRPAPDLTLFAGDLAHAGDGPALGLGREILMDLPGTLLLVPGEGDASPDSSGAWGQLFGEAGFLHTYQGLNLLGLYTAWLPTPIGPVFQVGEAQARWLARELPRLDPETPLLILSHAPLDRIFHPWQQWTGDAFRLLPLLGRFNEVLCLHGHVHQAGVRGQGSGVSRAVDHVPFMTGDLGQIAENRLSHQAIPATAWPLPVALQGTPAALCPGQGPQGCGWGLVSHQQGAWHFHPQIWLA
ncbi:MAG: metallophosphoesterase [Thermodesulfobacteriota bacterium]